MVRLVWTILGEWAESRWMLDLDQHLDFGPTAELIRGTLERHGDGRRWKKAADSWTARQWKHPVLERITSESRNPGCSDRSSVSEGSAQFWCCPLNSEPCYSPRFTDLLPEEALGQSVGLLFLGTRRPQILYNCKGQGLLPEFRPAYRSNFPSLSLVVTSLSYRASIYKKS